VADPWTEDFAALGERSAQDLASLASTRTLLTRPKESKMRFFLNRPLLAFALLLALVGVASGAAYAVDRLFIRVEPDQSPAEIERTVGEQLEAAGIKASVSATKPRNGQLEIQIEASDKNVAEGIARGIQIEVPGGDGEVVQHQLMVQLDVEGKLTPEVQRALVEATAKVGEPGDSPAELEAHLRASLAAHGFTDVTIVVADGIARVTVRVPE
jgi:hypothetical protein